MRIAGGRLGAAQAAERQDVAVIVDALRASATTASLLHYGVKEIIVVEDMEAAFAEALKRPGTLLVGERGGLKVDGFDLGNSPLQADPGGLSETVIFSSSNMSRCCVGAATCPVAILGTLPNLSATAVVAFREAREARRNITLVPAGSVLDEGKLVLEDYVAAGALLARLAGLAQGQAVASGDAARAAEHIWAAAKERGVTDTFVETDNGESLIGMGFAADVRFAAKRDVFEIVPRVTGTYVLDNGERAAVLTKAV
ncbi:MAG: 2-phosphosulfolactate phosphatase, partial [Armatimonadota bacterium]